MRFALLLILAVVAFSYFNPIVLQKRSSSYRHQLRDSLSDQSVQVYRLNESDSFSSKPPLLFLPGIGGEGKDSLDSLKSLSLVYDIWALSVKPDDKKSTFLSVATTCVHAIKDLKKPVVIIGESFGGLLALYLASRLPAEKLDKIVAINPATSYDRTIWAAFTPIVSTLRKAFPMIVRTSRAISELSPEPVQELLGNPIVDRINATETAIVNELNKPSPTTKSFTERLMTDVMEWRLENWLTMGTFLMEGKYSRITTPTLLLAGSLDYVLPSTAESRRLKRDMSSSKVEVIELGDCGHQFLNGDVDLGKILSQSSTFSDKPPEQPTYECTFPEASALEAYDKQFGSFLKSFSPVFLSTDARGNVIEGLTGVPSGSQGRPVLLVGNHQLYGADMSLIIRQFIEERNTLVRGLAHPFIMNGVETTRKTNLRELLREASSVAAENNGPSSSTGTLDLSSGELGTALTRYLKRFGAVEVSPISLYRLLQRNETIMLFPGGVNEAFHLKTNPNTVIWPEKTDFIRMAATFDAIVVPFAAIGMAESAKILLDGADIDSAPVYGYGIKRLNSFIPQARAGGSEYVVPPLLFPLLPSRNYFLFTQPYDTRQLNANNKTACKEAYAEVRSRVENGIKKLQAFRDADQYKDFIPRAFYETTRGATAPTASFELLNSSN